MSEQREAFAKRKQKIPSDEDLTKRFQQVRAVRLATLGQVERKLGRTAQARKLLEEAYAVNPSNGAVAGALGEMAVKEGNEAKALDYLISARLTGSAPE